MYICIYIGTVPGRCGPDKSRPGTQFRRKQAGDAVGPAAVPHEEKETKKNILKQPNHSPDLEA